MSFVEHFIHFAVIALSGASVLLPYIVKNKLVVQALEKDISVLKEQLGAVMDHLDSKES